MTDTLRYRVCPHPNLRWVIRDCLANREVLNRGWTNASEAQDIADALNAAFSAGGVHAGVDAALLNACESLLPHVKDVVQRGSVAGEDTSHYSDARAVRTAEAVIQAARARAAHLDQIDRLRTTQSSSPEPRRDRESPRMRVDVDNGKYTVIQEADGRLHALRNGLPWRECVGDKLVFCLAADLEEARAALVKIASVESRPQDKDTWTGRAMLTMRQTARSTLQDQGVSDPAASLSEVPPANPDPTA